MSVLVALLLADGRFPSGGHAHSGGVEEAATSGRVADLESLRAFVAGRLETAGRVAAGLAAVACGGRWPEAVLDAEADARMASPALRAASRRQGRQLLRSAVHAWPAVARSTVESPHHALAVGVVSAAAGLAPVDAARWAAYDAVMTPATAAVRLLGLDPFLVSAVVAGLAGAIDEVAAEAAAFAAGEGAVTLDDLPCPASPLLDLGAELHALREVRLFAS
ncbi:MAG: urease accessory protein [Actinomycetota bacterium]|jgi:urease accessory protein|nr:urease accessory protein [Actinomycetota bacterium]